MIAADVVAIGGPFVEKTHDLVIADIPVRNFFEDQLGVELVPRAFAGSSRGARRFLSIIAAETGRIIDCIAAIRKLT